MKSGYIDIVCNVFTPEAVRKGLTGIDEDFKAQVRMDPKMRPGVSIADYLKRMDRAGIERSLLIAVRAGDLRVRGSFHMPYEMVAKICAKYPDRFSGLAGIDPTLGVQGPAGTRRTRSRSSASSARTGTRTGSRCRSTHRRSTRTTRAAPSSTSRS